MKSQDILNGLGVKRESEILPKIMFTIGIAVTVKYVIDKEQSIYAWLIPLLLFAIPLFQYWILKTKELKINNVLAAQKSVVIMAFPSNLNLLKKLLYIPENESIKNNKFGIKKVILLQTDSFPKKDIREEIVRFLKAYGIKVKIIKVNSIDNPKELQIHFKNIFADIKNKETYAVNITTGKATTSIFFYELAHIYGIEIHYLSSSYDTNNKPIKGSENIYKLEESYVDKDNKA